MSRIKTSLSLGLLLACFCLSGCALLNKHVGSDLEFDQLALENGETHRDDVLDQFGPPSQMTALEDGYAFVYEHVDIREFQFGLGNPLPILRWFKLLIATADYHHDVLVIHFNHDHMLVAHSDSRTHFDLGNSMAVQPILSVQPMFDTSAVESELIPISTWGMSCLNTVPVTLNRAQSMDSGASGFEQLGTSPEVGQRSTELHQSR